MKKNLKSLLNRRAISIAARLSGPHQDQELKDYEKILSKTETELTRLRMTKQSKPNQLTASSVIIEGGKVMPIEKLFEKLDKGKNEAKDLVRLHRLKIREDGDNHPEFGLAAEEELQSCLRDKNYSKGN